MANVEGPTQKYRSVAKYGEMPFRHKIDGELYSLCNVHTRISARRIGSPYHTISEATVLVGVILIDVLLKSERKRGSLNNPGKGTTKRDQPQVAGKISAVYSL